MHFLFFNSGAVIADETLPENRPLEAATMQVQTFERLQKLFDIAYFIALEEEPYAKFPRLVQLEKRHAVDLGEAYNNEIACKTFVKYSAQVIRRELQDHLDVASTTLYKYHSVFTDGTTDKSVAEREVIYVKVLEDGIPRMKYMA